MPHVLVTILVVGFAMAPAIGFIPDRAAAQATTPAGTDATANEDLVRRFFELASQGELDDLGALVSPDFVIRTAPPGEGSSLETLTQTFEAVRAGLPDFTMGIDDLFSQGDMVVARVSISGTHEGDFFGAAPTGARIETTAIDVWRVEDGKLAENWHLEDILGVMEQIAVAATPRAASPAPASTPDVTESVVAPADAATIDANVALARRFHDEIFEQGNLDVADEILAPGFVWHFDVPTGVEGVESFAGDVRSAFRDLTLTADQVIAEGDRVAILWTLNGTHEGEFRGVPATGTSVSTPGVDIYRIENGRIAEVWTVGDELGLLMQLGAFPEFGGEAATPSA